MNKEKIEWLASMYSKSKSDLTASDLFAEMEQSWKGILVSRSKRFNIPTDEVEFIANESLFKSLRNYDLHKGKFIALFNVNLKRGCIDYLRTQCVEIKDNAGETYFVPQVELYGLESEVASANAVDSIAEHQKNNDQRQLIANLLSNADETTRQSVSAYMVTDSFRSAAKLLGKKDKNSVSRLIRKLARSYDANRFGDYHDYLVG